MDSRSNFKVNQGDTRALTHSLNQLSALHSQLLHQALDLGSIGLPEHQFKPFKRQLMAFYHDHFKPSVHRVLQGTDHVGAVPTVYDNLGKKGGCP